MLWRYPYKCQKMRKNMAENVKKHVAMFLYNYPIEGLWGNMGKTKWEN